jgi:hypothetical protein
VTPFQAYPRAWCNDECGRRVILDRHTKQRGGVCAACYRAAIEQMERDDEQRRLRGYLPEELERI